jgi:branched-chain amino acid transport system ATP-binding protein
MTAPLLEIDHVDVRYGEARALFGVSLAVDAGTMVAVLGANGAGKSSLAAVIAGSVRPARGRVVLDGDDLTGAPPHAFARAGVAYVPEGRGIFPHLSVIDNLRVLLRHAVPARERADAIERALELFPVLGERRQQRAGTLSGGEQQMLALARVLAAPPRLLVADEMSLGLAPKMADVVFEALVRAHHDGVTVVLVEQYAERALSIADTAVVLHQGTVQWSGAARDAGAEVLAGYLGTG